MQIHTSQKDSRHGEARLHPRVPVRGKAMFQVGEDSLLVNLINISPGGVQGECSDAVFDRLNELRGTDGTWPPVPLVFDFDDKRPLDGKQTPAKLVYYRRLSRTIYCIGLVFSEPSANFNAALRATFNPQAPTANSKRA